MAYLLGNLRTNLQRRGLPHRLRLPRPAVRLRHPVLVVPSQPVGVGRAEGRLRQHAAHRCRGHRHLAGPRRHHRRRPAVEQLPRALGRDRLRRDVSQHSRVPAGVRRVLRRDPAVAAADQRGDRVARLTVFSNRGLYVPWIEGHDNSGSFLVLLGVGLLVGVVIAAWRTRRFEATGAPHHRFWWGVGALALVGVISATSRSSAPISIDHARARRPPRRRRHQRQPQLRRAAHRPQHLHRQPHRRDRARRHPGRPPRADRSGMRAQLVELASASA